MRVGGGEVEGLEGLGVKGALGRASQRLGRSETKGTAARAERRKKEKKTNEELTGADVVAVLWKWSGAGACGGRLSTDTKAW